jgi:hypothetical protein
MSFTSTFTGATRARTGKQSPRALEQRRRESTARNRWCGGGTADERFWCVSPAEGMLIKLSSLVTCRNWRWLRSLRDIYPRTGPSSEQLTQEASSMRLAASAAPLHQRSRCGFHAESTFRRARFGPTSWKWGRSTPDVRLWNSGDSRIWLVCRCHPDPCAP